MIALQHFVVVLPSINDEINGKPGWIRIIQQRRVAIFETRIDCRQSRINGTAMGSQVLRMTSHVIARNCARYTTRGERGPRSISIKWPSYHPRESYRFRERIPSRFVILIGIFNVDSQPPNSSYLRFLISIIYNLRS